MAQYASQLVGSDKNNSVAYHLAKEKRNTYRSIGLITVILGALMYIMTALIVLINYHAPISVAFWWGFLLSGAFYSVVLLGLEAAYKKSKAWHDMMKAEANKDGSWYCD